MLGILYIISTSIFFHILNQLNILLTRALHLLETKSTYQIDLSILTLTTIPTSAYETQFILRNTSECHKLLQKRKRKLKHKQHKKHYVETAI